MKFSTLKDMARTISRNKVKQIEILGNDGNESRTQQLYDGIIDGHFNSDEEAANHFFGTTDSQDTRYRKLKTKLIRQLINTSLFVDPNQPMFNERAKAYYNCYRDFASGMILIGRGASKAGVFILEQVLAQTIKYEFTELTTEITQTLRREYARTVVNQGNHEKMAQLHRQYEEKRRLEILALDYYETLINYYIQKRSPNTIIHETASNFYEELAPLAHKVDTSQFYFYWFQIGIIKYLSINDCANALAICNPALDLLSNRKNTNRGALGGIYAQKLSCITQLRIFDGDGHKTANTLLELSEEGSTNWFRSHELHLHFCLFAKEYAETLKIFTIASRHEKFALLEGTANDNWRLYGGYLHLLAALKKLDVEKVREAVGEFRYGKLSNEIEIIDKDREGMNIPLVLLPLLYALANNTYNSSEISLEALEKYRKRYLDNPMNRRSAAFLNLLIAYTKKDYQSASAEKKIKKELEILASEQPQVAGQTFAVEIIPYEDLWKMLTER